MLLFAATLNSDVNLITFFSALALLFSLFSVIYPFFFVRRHFDRFEKWNQVKLMLTAVVSGVCHYGWHMLVN